MVDAAEGGRPLLRIPDAQDLVAEEEEGVVRTVSDDVHPELLDEEPACFDSILDTHIDMVEAEEPEFARGGLGWHGPAHGLHGYSASVGPGGTQHERSSAVAGRSPATPRRAEAARSSRACAGRLVSRGGRSGAGRGAFGPHEGASGPRRTDRFSPVWVFEVPSPSPRTVGRVYESVRARPDPMEGLRTLEVNLLRTLATLERRGVFAEILAERSWGEGTRVNRRAVSSRCDPRLQGAVLRCWTGERWVEAATSSLEPAPLAEMAGECESSLSAGSGRSTPPGVSSTTVLDRATSPAHPASELGSDEMIALSKDVLRWAMEVPEVRDTEVEIHWAEEERAYLNSAGARAYQRLSRVVSVVIPLAFENGTVESDVQVRGGLGGRELLSSLTEEAVRAAAERARSLLGAGRPPAGEMPVLLDPSVAGVFAHESFGHGTEADQFLRDRSYLKARLGSIVGPEALTIVDDGSLPGAWGSLYFDDEGHPGHRTPLVENGRFVGALHDRETAAALHAVPTGNTRRADFLSRAYVRMTNTFVGPGTWSLEELLQEAKNGVLLEAAQSGIEDPLGGQMQIKVHRGHRIVNGELGELVRSMALSGKVLDFLNGIRGIGREGDLTMLPGSCGKGYTDLLPVSDGGEYVLSNAVVGPA